MALSNPSISKSSLKGIAGMIFKITLKSKSNATKCNFSLLLIDVSITTSLRLKGLTVVIFE